MMFKTCTNCKQVFELSNFYKNKKTNSYYSKCIDCFKEIERLQYLKEKEESCGGYLIKSNPNEYANDIQKNCVFDIMIKLGFTFNKENGIWWKKGYKDKNGNFPNLKKFVKKNKSRVSKEMVEQIFIMRNKGYSYGIIARKLNISTTTVGKIFNDGKH